MKNRLHLLVLLAGLTVSCKAVKDEPGTDIIPPDSMAMIMADIYIAEAAVNIKSARVEHTDTLATEYYLNIYQKYGLSRERFDDNFRHYSHRPEEFKSIYDQVLEIISTHQAKTH